MKYPRKLYLSQGLLPMVPVLVTGAFPGTNTFYPNRNQPSIGAGALCPHAGGALRPDDPVREAVSGEAASGIAGGDGAVRRSTPCRVLSLCISYRITWFSILFVRLH